MMEAKAIQKVVLDPVTLYSEERVSGELAQYIKAGEWQVLAHSDHVARRHILRMFGRSVSIELTAPATWWDHVKMALRARWPKLFERLRIKMRTESASVGAVMAGLPPSNDRHRVIPYFIEPPGQSRLAGGTVRDNEPPWEPNEESLEEYVRSIANERYRVHRRKIEAVVVHPSDFLDFCRASEARNYYRHTGDRQVIDTAIGPVRIDIDASQTPGVVGIP